MLWVATAAFAIGQGIAGTAWQATPPHDLEADWSRVRISNPLVKTVVRHGLDEASRLLEQPRCQAILTEFHDRQDRPLADKLTALGVNISRYLRLVIVLDGSQNQRCGDTLSVHGARESGRVRLRPLGPANLAREFRATRGGPHPRGPAHARARRESAILGRDHREGPTPVRQFVSNEPTW